MTSQPLAVVIVNRAAQMGGAARRWPVIEAALTTRLGAIEPLFTAAPGHATALARAALGRGVRRFVAVGGDGTVNETLNGLLEPSGRLAAPDAVLCPIPAGTANELCRALGYLRDPVRAFDAAAGRATRTIDLMRVRCTGLDGRPVDRFDYLDDGVLDLIEMRDVSRLGVLLGVMPKLYSGGHLSHPKVRTSRGASFRFDSDVETLVDVDGEMAGRLPLEVSVLPAAFSVGIPDR
ncbi:diacylglycerol/lipid kinase family protein [Reyranella sp.]|uniref:diacylglycerol/lipid kinase family protein n=1 Tax=Reyranella sp. TaxID=1929291 RepID=UPI003782F895